MKDNTKTRMLTIIKTKFNISEEIGLSQSSQSFEGKYNIGFRITLEFPSQRKKYPNRSINKEIGHLWSESDLRESTISDLESPSNFQVKKNLLKSVQKQRNYAYIENAKKDFYISAFCSLNGKPTEKNIYRIDAHM